MRRRIPRVLCYFHFQIRLAIAWLAVLRVSFNEPAAVSGIVPDLSGIRILRTRHLGRDSRVTGTSSLEGEEVQEMSDSARELKARQFNAGSSG